MPPAPKPPHSHKPTPYVVDLHLDKTTVTRLHLQDSVATGIAFDTKCENDVRPKLVGDVEIQEADFLDDQDQFVGHEKGVWTRVHAPEPGGVEGIWHGSVVHYWSSGPKGTKGGLTVQIVTDFDDEATKTNPHLFAITGGTGDYLGAYGQIEFKGVDDITFRFWVP
jgi:hypothetical protein